VEEQTILSGEPNQSNTQTQVMYAIKAEDFDNVNLPACFASNYTAQLNEKGTHL